jgi:transcriptional regulator with XRE-family HTH domain
MPKRDLSIAFGKVLKEKRKKLGLSQEALAEKADVHPTYISLLERGGRSPGLDVAGRIANAMGLKLAKMIVEAEKPP